ncbi:Cell division control protein 2-like 3 [Symbiodinium microadriaticum]|uniref:Cell division control protein 2-like 3 n=1 Tax=Symbiodinium microadriaticum TaxID=2951 RepID=A0A1Q9CI24_SYMMI|nr:Cell division control protein 2-like 3 [Symbiodinium microadriaticum]
MPVCRPVGMKCAVHLEANKGDRGTAAEPGFWSGERLSAIYERGAKEGKEADAAAEISRDRWLAQKEADNKWTEQELELLVASSRVIWRKDLLGMDEGRADFFLEGRNFIKRKASTSPHRPAEANNVSQPTGPLTQLLSPKGSLEEADNKWTEQELELLVASSRVIWRKDLLGMDEGRADFFLEARMQGVLWVAKRSTLCLENYGQNEMKMNTASNVQSYGSIAPSTYSASFVGWHHGEIRRSMAEPGTAVEPDSDGESVKKVHGTFAVRRALPGLLTAGESRYLVVVAGFVNMAFYAGPPSGRLDVDKELVPGTKGILGEGINGQVRRATERNTGREVAVKRISCVNLSEQRRQMLVSEVGIFLQVHHQNIVKLLEVYESEVDQAVLLVMESGSLASRGSAPARKPLTNPRRLEPNRCMKIMNGFGCGKGGSHVGDGVPRLGRESSLGSRFNKDPGYHPDIVIGDVDGGYG